jgi:hypothetical protein
MDASRWALRAGMSNDEDARPKRIFCQSLVLKSYGNSIWDQTGEGCDLS